MVCSRDLISARKIGYDSARARLELKKNLDKNYSHNEAIEYYAGFADGLLDNNADFEARIAALDRWRFFTIGPKITVTEHVDDKFSNYSITKKESPWHLHFGH